MSKILNVNFIAETLRHTLSKEEDFIALHEPSFSGNEWPYVKDCLDSGWVSSVGKYVDRFERQLEDYTGISHAIAVVNGTAALHIALKLVGVEKNDEVLLPALTFVATANAVVYCEAVPHFVDSSEKTLGLCPIKLENYLREISILKGRECFNRFTGRRIKAVLPMHTFGHPVDLDPLAALCQRFHLKLVEDAAESLGSFYKGIHTGNWGQASAFSFNGNKIITTGGGGAILTNDEELARRAKHLTTTAKVPHPWGYFHDEVGYNYRLPNLNAALGCAQIEELPIFLEKKRALAARYQEAFKDVAGVRVFNEPKNTKSNYWLNALLIDKGLERERNKLIERLNGEGIMTRPVWTLLHKLPMYEACPRMPLCDAESLEGRIINIPSSPKLGGFR